MLYRLFQPADFSQLYAIEEVCFEPPFRFGRRTMRRLVSSANSATWIAEENRQMAGFAIVYWTPEADQTTAYVQTLEVAPAQRNRGIATELLRRVENSAIAADAEAIWLHVAESNTPAIALYENRGYIRQGREPNYYAEGIGALIYARTLGQR